MKISIGFMGISLTHRRRLVKTRSGVYTQTVCIFVEWCFEEKTGERCQFNVVGNLVVYNRNELEMVAMAMANDHYSSWYECRCIIYVLFHSNGYDL